MLKLKILALVALFAAMRLSIVYWEDIKLASIDLWGFWEYQDWVATYGYRKCIEKIGEIKGKYSCDNFILTLNSENWWRNKDKESPKNSNWTKDYGLCQLNSAYHSSFIKSEDFKDPYKQIEYCLWVWIDAKNKWKMPRYGYYKRNERNRYNGEKKVKFIDPPLSDNIAQAEKEPELKATKRRCRMIYQTKTDNETIQLDTVFGKFLSWFQNVDRGTKVFTCKDIW